MVAICVDFGLWFGRRRGAASARGGGDGGWGHDGEYGLLQAR